MAVAKNKTRIIFTCTKNQAKWLQEVAEETGITVSKLIRWLIEKNIQNIQQWATPQELETLTRILRTKWIKEPDEE